MDGYTHVIYDTYLRNQQQEGQNQSVAAYTAGIVGACVSPGAVGYKAREKSGTPASIGNVVII